MSAGDLFDRGPNYTVEAVVDSLLADLRGKGLAGHVVKDDYRQLSPPEAATWTGKRFQLALLLSGREVWMEVREFTRVGVVAAQPVRNRADFASTVVNFAQEESS